MHKRKNPVNHKIYEVLIALAFQLAEKEGFEPPDLLQSTVFKTAAFDRSAISPVCCYHFVIASANIRTFFGYASVFLEKIQLFLKELFNCFISFDLENKKNNKILEIGLIVYIFFDF